MDDDVFGFAGNFDSVGLTNMCTITRNATRKVMMNLGGMCKQDALRMDAVFKLEFHV